MLFEPVTFHPNNVAFTISDTLWSHRFRGDFNFPITNFPFLSSNIPSSPMTFYLLAHTIQCFILRARRLSSKQLVCILERLTSSFGKFYGRYRDLIKQSEVSLSRMLINILQLDQLEWLPNRLLIDFHQLYNLHTELAFYQIASGFHEA